MNTLKNFLNDEQGQDLIEYTLLMAFIVLASAAVFGGAGSQVNQIWTGVNTEVASAATLVS